MLTSQILQWKHSKHSKLYLIRGDFGKKEATSAVLRCKALGKEPDQLDWVPALCGFVPGSPKSSWADGRSLLKWFSA